MNKTKNISARVTEKEYEEIAKLAKKNSMKLSDYVVQSCLYQNTDAKLKGESKMIDLIQLGHDKQLAIEKTLIGSSVYYLNTEIIHYDENDDCEFGLLKRLKEPDTIPTGYRALCKQVIETHKGTKFYKKFISLCRYGILYSSMISKNSTDLFPTVRYKIKDEFDSDDSVVVSRIANSPDELLLEFLMDICYCYETCGCKSLFGDIIVCKYNKLSNTNEIKVIAGTVQKYSFDNGKGPCNIVISSLHSEDIIYRVNASNISQDVEFNNHVLYLLEHTESDYIELTKKGESL